ncbi:EAL domain-containing protein [Vibrio sinaloensis]|uniref:EAL domain-containing protein n=1 Tax=Photobacterium sp. (strain ATCC 43367) TaxID=379097 RepID=UPI0035EF0BD8
MPTTSAKLPFMRQVFPQQVMLQFVLMFGVLVSFQVSELFTLQSERVHILSFTASLITAAFLRFRKAALIGVVSGLLLHYLAVSQRDPAIAIVFALLLPGVVFCFTETFLSVTRKLNKGSHLLKATYYLSILVVVYPIVITLAISLTTRLFNYPFMDDWHYYGYAILSSALTQVLLTPMFLVLFSLFSQPSRDRLFTLDKDLKRYSEYDHLYLLWVGMSTVILLGAGLADDLLTLNALCIILVPVIGIGLGGFGFLQPSLVMLGLSLINCYNSVNALDDQSISVQTFYSLVAILFAINSIFFMMVAQTIKNHMTLKAVVESERKDPYTALYTLAQLRDDNEQFIQPTLISIDLSEITRRLKTLGLAGKGELMTQLSCYLSAHHTLCKTAYVAPFSTSLIYLVNKPQASGDQLLSLHKSLREFSFDWQNRSIKILDPKVKFGHVSEGQDIVEAVSTLCMPSKETLSFNHVEEVRLSEAKEYDIVRLSQIQSAFDQDEFDLYCQPYRNLKSDESGLSFEVLLRLPDKTGQVLPPAEFFPLIHEFGLEVELDKWVVSNTFKLLAEHVSDWDKIGHCCINLTAQALMHEELEQFVVTRSERLDVPLNKICFEITESMPLSNELQASLNVTALQSHGCTIALDDFGTGYASLDYLRRIPVDILKIDGSFVRHIDVDQTDRSIVKNISQIAQNMDLVTVAEFVETETHADILTELNIHYAQGFAIAKPRPLVQELRNL